MKTPEEILQAIMELEIPDNHKIGFLVGSTVAIMKQMGATKEIFIVTCGTAWDNLSEPLVPE